ncbi:MAG: DUF4290 domain-containing protein [Saprospiraceae bacterium]|nr:DUF4290 domain-containing protein [Saprospiraceae bacterium]
MAKHLDIEYNSSRENLTISEYGRHVQKLIQHAKTIEDRDARQRFVEGVIALMYQMNPQHKNVGEVQEKLWKHAYRISGYDLDVTPPEGIELTEATNGLKPEKIPYPHQVRRYRHYGTYIQEMLERALALEDEEKRMEFMSLIGSYMKMAYKTWNREHYANDETIKADLIKMAKGQITSLEGIHLDLLNIPTYHSSSSKKQKPKKSGRSHNKNNRKRKRK